MSSQKAAPVLKCENKWKSVMQYKLPQAHSPTAFTQAHLKQVNAKAK